MPEVATHKMKYMSKIRRKQHFRLIKDYTGFYACHLDFEMRQEHSDGGFDVILLPIKLQLVLVFRDDIEIFSRSLDEHTSNLGVVLLLLQRSQAQFEKF